MSAIAAALLASAVGAASPVGDSIEPELARLEGHEVVVAPDRQSYVIADIAGEGPPEVGVVARDGAQLILETATARFRLVGPLAVPRIAGPGYKVWVIGDVSDGGDALMITRIGVLAAPRR